VAAGEAGYGSTPSAAAAAAALESGQPLVDMFCKAMQQQQQVGATPEDATEQQQQQQQQGGATVEDPTEQQQQQQLLKRLYSLLVTSLKGLALCKGDSAAGGIRLMLASIDAAELAVHLCKAAASSGSSSSSSRGALSVQLLGPWMALATLAVTTAIEAHMSLIDELAPSLAEIKRSSTTDTIEKEIASNPDAPLGRMLPVVTWLVEQLQQHQQGLGVPAELVAELQQLHMLLPASATMTGACVRVDEAAVQAGTVNSLSGAEMRNVMHRVAMTVLAQTPHAYACNNPGMCGSLDVPQGSGVCVCGFCRCHRRGGCRFVYTCLVSVASTGGMRRAAWDACVQLKPWCLAL
jgi:hypothetical protein